MRLNRYLSSCGICSRREADRLIEEGRVRVNGLVASLGMEASDGDQVRVDGRTVSQMQKEVWLAVNKPRGVVVTTDRSHGDRLLEDLIHVPERVFPVGRLDKDSEGLILMTNRGDLSNRIQKARGFHEKEYQVTVDRPVTEDFLKTMSGGVWLEDLARRTRPCKVWKTGARTFSIILTEGMNRQIRRMCQACGCQVTRLRRIRVMNILLGDLETGRYRNLSEKERKVLKDNLADGGRKERIPALRSGKGLEGADQAESSRSGWENGRRQTCTEKE